MQSLSSPALVRRFDVFPHLSGAVALARRSIVRARTDSVLRSLGDEQLLDAALDRPARRPQSASDARLMSTLMSMR